MDKAELRKASEGSKTGIAFQKVVDTIPAKKGLSSEQKQVIEEFKKSLDRDSIALGAMFGIIQAISLNKIIDIKTDFPEALPVLIETLEEILNIAEFQLREYETDVISSKLLN